MSSFDQLMSFFREPESSVFITQVLQFLVWALAILLITWLARKGINRTVTDNTIRYRAGKVVRFFGYVLIVLLGIISFTGKVHYFTITIGIMSAGLAFALQEVILSVAGWITIFSANMYKPGDRIEINKVKGDVIDISITKTTLMEIGEWVNSDNYTGRIVQVSNAFVFKGAVYNYSADFPFVWDELTIPVHYSSDLKYANEVLQSSANEVLSEYANYAKQHWKKMINKYLIENANVDPTVALRLTDNWAEFSIRYVVDYKQRRSTRDRLSKAIYKAILDSDGKLSIGSATIELTNVKATGKENI